MVQGYHVTNIQGMDFYQIDSWQDTSKLMGTAYQAQGSMIWVLYGEVDRLKQRIKNLERKVNELTSD